MESAQKISFIDQIKDFVRMQIANAINNMPKAVPCHVSKILDNDFLEVTIDANSVFTLPKVTVPQSFSKYHREPTQVGDKGYIVPNDYYLGGESGLSGGVANLYPRGNLTTGSFQPISQKSFSNRDKDQYLVTGGPSGIQIQSKDEKNTIVIDKDNNIQLKIDDNTQIKIDKQQQKIAISVKTDKIVYLGGPGKNDSLYDFVSTPSGPSINVKAKFVNQEET